MNPPPEATYVLIQHAIGQLPRPFGNRSPAISLRNCHPEWLDGPSADRSLQDFITAMEKHLRRGAKENYQLALQHQRELSELQSLQQQGAYLIDPDDEPEFPYFGLGQGIHYSNPPKRKRRYFTDEDVIEE